MEKPLEKAGVDLQLGWGRVSGNHQGRGGTVSQVDGDSDMVKACWLCLGRAQQRTMVSASTSA